jgi:hypothetical protein
MAWSVVAGDAVGGLFAVFCCGQLWRWWPMSSAATTMSCFWRIMVVPRVWRRTWLEKSWLRLRLASSAMAVMMSRAPRVDSRPPRVLSSRAGLVSAFFQLGRSSSIHRSRCSRRSA